ncbi:MAG TPA: homocysteine S-methyltransferase family protein, partial [Candidatus Alistipes merdipullorum]|nr:homocysteine S-methyltransferase family protein [Candidatus Alistipes merdipullorum]
MDDLKKALAERILVLDGAVGTELMRRGGRGCLEAMVLDNEAAVAAVHESYLDAGADIVTTDTLCADALCLEHYGLSERSYDIARRAAEIARACVERYSAGSRRRFVAGSVGPSTRNISLANDVTEEQLGDVYETVIRGLLDGGVDLILVETVMDSRNASIAVERCRRLNAEIPIAVSAVLSRLEGRVANGAPIATFLKELPMDDIALVGFNCSSSPRAMGASLETLAA